MRKTFKILQDIIDLLDDFEKKNTSKADLKDFVLWLNTVLFDHADKHEGNNFQINALDMELTHLLIMQNKHFKIYSKKALKNSKIATPEDFSFLYHLSMIESFRKMEIINIHQLEAPSGIEVLKRLLKSEFIEEFDDIEDRRAKRIKITEKGRNELAISMKNMQKVFETIPAELDLKQKIQFVILLTKMNDFHVDNVNEISFDD